MGLARKRLVRPMFEVLEKAYLASKGAAHTCPVATSVDGGTSRDEWATRFCEAVMIAAQVVPDRTAIAASQREILADYSYGLFGRMCPHGVGVDADALSRFLSETWGAPMKLPNVEGPPDVLRKRTGVVFFAAERSRGEKPHLDLWNGSKCLGVPFRQASELLFWELSRGSSL